MLFFFFFRFVLFLFNENRQHPRFALSLIRKHYKFGRIKFCFIKGGTINLTFFYCYSFLIDQQTNADQTAHGTVLLNHHELQ